jgi:hypothetical protein
MNELTLTGTNHTHDLDISHVAFKRLLLVVGVYFFIIIECFNLTLFFCVHQADFDDQASKRTSSCR